VSELVYDFGMNNGDDVDYYLRKGHKVIAVEANPKLCTLCEERFRSEIKSGSLTVLNVALSDGSSSGSVNFYIHKKHHFLSQLLEPAPGETDDFERIRVPQQRASGIVNEYGSPHYIKIDIEGLDSAILRDLFDAGIKPDFISAEAHSVNVFAILVAGGYNCFNLVDGPSVRSAYGNTVINTLNGTEKYSFKAHSAGPYGEDLASPWLDSDSFFYLLAAEELGWKDIHASKILKPVSRRYRRILSLREHLYDLGPSFGRAVRFRLLRQTSIPRTR
jgi:FkbM family methyltransferase